MATVAIIGAGTSGLPAIKSCLEAGLIPTCYEAYGQVGGLWNYVDGECPDRATVFRGVVTNTSRDMTAFSDFLHPDDHPLYLPTYVYTKYLSMYADHFNLSKSIKLNHKVLRVDKTDDHEETGRWLLCVKDLKNEEVFELIFDKIIVASGHHSNPFTPEFPGQDIFQGQQLHSHQYRTPEQFEGKNVLVVGFGNSGCDISAECATVTKKVILSTRKKGGWVLPRVVSTGLPTDGEIGRRSAMLILKFLPKSIINDMFEKISNNAWDHDMYGLKPDQNIRITNQFPCINDRFPLEVAFGKIKIEAGIERLTKNGVVFQDGHEEPIDVIIYATGFKAKYQFLSNVFDIQTSSQNLYKLVFPTYLSRNSLAFIGLVDSDGRSTLSLSEMQSRWVAQVFAGNVKLPPLQEMKKDIEKDLKMKTEVFGEGHTYPFYIHSTEYTDEIASLAGVKPNLWKLLFTDPKLYWHVFTGPFHNSQFRLHGPHPWSGARDAILGYEKRLKSIVRGQTSSKETHGSGYKFKKAVFIVTTSLVMYYAYQRYVNGQDVLADNFEFYYPRWLKN